MPVTVVPYDDGWPGAFEREAVLLRDVLRPWLVGGVEHIGSTAVPGLAAKPILDMLAGVRALAQARDAVARLEALGYRYADHRPHEALWFSKQPSDDYASRTHQLHLTEVGSALWRERLAFRDALRADDGLRDEYQALKQRLADSELDDYVQRKRPFVARVLRSRGVDLA